MNVLTITVQLQEPVLVTAPGGDPNTDESLPYIPGSVLRGALAHRYLQAHEADDTFTALFLSGKTRFLNGYPELSGVRTSVVPLSWRLEKDAVAITLDALTGTGAPIYDLAFGPGPTPDKRLDEPFFHLDGLQVETAGPIYEIAVHTRRERLAGRPTLEEGDLFRYRALATGQCFVVEIWAGEEGHAEQLTTLLEDQELLLGGSSTADYGRTSIITVSRGEPNVYRGTDIAAGETLTVYLASDAILRHPQTGQPGAHIAEVLSLFLPGRTLQIEPGKAFKKMGWVGGFNSTWGLPLPQVWAVQRGSQWVLKTDAAIAAAELAAIEETGIGERLAEGFGCVRFNPAWARAERITLFEQESDTSTTDASSEEVDIEEPDFPRLSSREQALMDHMNRRLAVRQLDRLLLVAIHEQADKYRGVLSKSQIARLRLRLRAEQGRRAGGFAQLRRYLTGTAERKSTDDQFGKSRLGGRGFRRWIGQFIGQTGGEQPNQWQPQYIWQVLGLDADSSQWNQADGRWQQLLLGPTPFVLDDELAHEYTIRLLEGVCEQIAKKDRQR
jgi:CRISPR-associated protein Csx10